MKAMLEISLHSYAYLNQQKWFSYYCLFLLFNATGEKSTTGSAWKGGGKEGEGGRGERREK
jgi:hypothetical protein